MIELEMQRHSGEWQWCPVFCCEGCRRQIEDPDTGIVEFALGPIHEPYMRTSEMRFWHRGCAAPKNPPDWGWMDLKVFATSLKNNLLVRR